MTYIDYMNQLWRSALLSPMPASEIALYAYLVNECNKRFWKMPFACSSTRISEDLRISRQTLITARKHLAERRLITFSEGKSRHLPSKYTMLEWTDDLTEGLTEGLTDNLTHDLTHIKDKDKELFIRKSSENFNSKKESKNGFSKQKENRRACPVPADGADYDEAF
ncbi:hypothetical protein DW158_19720 [Parabacteroides merdae]|jgi:hypothetical protein|nr:hypothetical protein DW158_19720 [Parabacteroides merdae]